MHSNDQAQYRICPLDCPNRASKIGKGYSYLFAMILTALLAWHSCTVKYSKHDGLEVSTRDIPTGLLVGYVLLVAGALGINTDPLAELVAKFLERK